MTILPKKKHCDTKKSDANSSNEGRNRLRGSSSWSSSAGVRSPEEYSGDDSYRSTTFESREASDTGSSSKRRHRSPPHRLKYHERHSEETDYNSSDEYDPQKLDQPCTEEMEGQFEQALKEKKGFVIKKMAQDGACLFRAVADQVYGDQEMHAVVRQHCMDYMLKNVDYFSHYVTEDFNSYIKRKRDNHCHGNHVEMQALSEMYNRSVEVYQCSIEPINIIHSSTKTDYEPIRLSYHNNVHYNSVINPNKPSVGVGLGLSGYKPLWVMASEALKQSEEGQIEKQMLEDKLAATDWEATNEAMEEAIARESYLQWLRETERRAKGPSSVARSSSSTASSSTSTCTESKRPTSPHQRERDRDTDSAPPSKSPRHSPSSPRHETLACASGSTKTSCKEPSSRTASTSANALWVEAKPGCSTSVSNPPSPSGAVGGAASATPNYLDYFSPTGYGLSQWEDENILATVLAESQKEYLEQLRQNVKDSNSEDESRS